MCIGINQGHHWEITEEQYLKADSIPGDEEYASDLAVFLVHDGRITHIFDHILRDSEVESAREIDAAYEVCLFKVRYAPDYKTVKTFRGNFVEALEFVRGDFGKA